MEKEWNFLRGIRGKIEPVKKAQKRSGGISGALLCTRREVGGLTMDTGTEPQLWQGDCLSILPKLPSHSVDLVLTDPPYNIGVCTQRRNKVAVNEWDRISDYVGWSLAWLTECQRVLKPNGVLYFWHNDMRQIPALLEAIRQHTELAFVSFCIWNKGETYRAKSWRHRDPDGKTALRSWFNICEYCLHFFNAPKDADASWKCTGLDRINSNPSCYRPIKEWYEAEKRRLGLTDADISEKYTAVTGRKPHMLRHYFRDSQFEIPTREVFEGVYEALGFRYKSDGCQGYVGLRKEYEGLRKEYEGLRNYHRCDEMHSNVWNHPPIPSHGRYHTCQKPVDILERILRVSCRPEGTVLDCFMGSGSTGVACVKTGRRFIGIERDPSMFDVANRRIRESAAD